MEAFQGWQIQDPVWSFPEVQRHPLPWHPLCFIFSWDATPGGWESQPNLRLRPNSGVTKNRGTPPMWVRATLSFPEMPPSWGGLIQTWMISWRWIYHNSQPLACRWGNTAVTPLHPESWLAATERWHLGTRVQPFTCTWDLVQRGHVPYSYGNQNFSSHFWRVAKSTPIPKHMPKYTRVKVLHTQGKHTDEQLCLALLLPYINALFTLPTRVCWHTHNWLATCALASWTLLFWPSGDFPNHRNDASSYIKEIRHRITADWLQQNALTDQDASQRGTGPGSMTPDYSTTSKIQTVFPCVFIWICEGIMVVSMGGGVTIRHEKSNFQETRTLGDLPHPAINTLGCALGTRVTIQTVWRNSLFSISTIQKILQKSKPGTIQRRSPVKHRFKRETHTECGCCIAHF